MIRLLELCLIQIAGMDTIGSQNSSGCWDRGIAAWTTSQGVILRMAAVKVCLFSGTLSPASVSPDGCMVSIVEGLHASVSVLVAGTLG